MREHYVTVDAVGTRCARRRSSGYAFFRRDVHAHAVLSPCYAMIAMFHIEPDAEDIIFFRYAERSC